MDAVQFRLLGTMEMLVGGVPARLPGAAERALLAILLLSPGRTVPATTLVDRLWSESSLPVDPMNALQIRVSKLRRSLRAAGADLLTRDHVGYRADIPPSAIDAEEFVALLRAARGRANATESDYTQGHLDAYDTALALWRGEPLADFKTEQWAMAEAARLAELRLSALSERAQIALALGRHREVATDLEPVVAEDPTLESLVGQLMVALYREGRQADALDVYTRTRKVLDDTLGLEPSVSLRSLHERVLRQDESLGGPSSSPVTAVPTGLGAQPNRREDREAPGRLPTVARPLIGRDHQLDALCDQLQSSRLTTLLGPGGAGKTSLALAAAARVAPDYDDGAVGVRLAPVSDPDQVPLAIADALGVPLDGAAADRDVRGRLTRYLAGRQMLLLIDNCEHVVDAAAAVVDEILAHCPQVTLLTTSREALAVTQELQVLVGPLAAAPEGTPPDRVLSFPACVLFVDRARHVRPNLELGDDDLLAVAGIARALDGLPLALELAAARVSAMSPMEIAERLAERFTLLTTGARTAEERQQTLRATVDWSYDLLTADEQRVFNRLSVFRGGFTLAAAEAVVGEPGLGPGAVLDMVGRLVERSLIVAEPARTTRYRMLETLRHYALERLVATDEHEVFAQRHAQYFHALTQEAELELRGHGQREALQRLRADQPNIRAALSWLSGPCGDFDAALTMAGALGLFWHLGRHLEGRETLADLLATGKGSPAARAHALQAVSIVERPRACLVHPSPRCAETAQESLVIFEDLGDRSRAALSRVLLAVEGVTGASPERSEALLSEAEEQFRKDGDQWGLAVISFVRTETALKAGDEELAVPTGRAAAAAFRQLEDVWGLSAILYHLGWGLRQFGRYDEAARVLEEAIDVAASAGLYNTVQWALADLGVTQLHRGDRAAARDYFHRASAASEHIGDGAGAVLSTYGHGLVAQTDGSWEQARQHFQSALEGFVQLGTPVPEGLALAGLARCAEAVGDAPTAQTMFEQALSTGSDFGEPALVATALEGLARLAEANGQQDKARQLVSEAADLRVARARPAPPHERRDLERPSGATAGAAPAGGGRTP